MSVESDKLKEQAELINLAMESVLSEDQARELIQGKIQDAFLLKLSIDVENRSGLLMVLISSYRNEILLLYSVFGDSPELKKIKTFEESGQFAHDFIEVTKSSGVDKSLSESVGRIVYRKLDKSTISSMNAFLESGEANRVVGMIQEGISTGLKIKNVKVNADVEKLSSIKFRHNSQLISPVIKPVDEPTADDPNAPKEKSGMEKQMEAVERGFSRVLQCKTVISPVAGIEFDELREKQKLLFQIPIDSEENKLIAKTLGALSKEGIPQPIIGEFIQLVSGNKEYYIYAKGPGGILLRAFEEGKVKLAVPKVASSAVTKEAPVEASSTSINLVVIVLAVLVILLIMIFIISG